MLQQLSKGQTGIDNLLNAIQAAEYLPRPPERLTTLEAEKAQPEASIEQEFCRHMDAVQHDIQYKGIVGEAAQKHQCQAEQLINEFARKYHAHKGTSAE